MPLLRLIAEKIGPFETLDIDFSDGHGNPHSGPQILAGVNGSGKSTVLRAIAWALSWSESGFPHDEWRHFLRGTESRVLVQASFGYGLLINAGTRDTATGWEHRLGAWVQSAGLGGTLGLFHSLGDRAGETVSHRYEVLSQEVSVAAYAPARSLSYLDSPAKMESLHHSGDYSLGFETTVQNRAIQRWLVDLFSRRALAKERGQDSASYDRTLTRFQDALRLVCGDSGIRIDVDLGPILEPRLIFHETKLNFSQLSDGIRTTLGWLADFMMRQDHIEAANGAGAPREGILLLDEIDLYLHPRLQRTLLPALRKALPDTQIIAASHSPFVISSCPDTCIHVLTLDPRGAAHACPPQKAPFGESVTATLKDFFGVESRFDVQTEEDLHTWDNLKREQAVGKLNPARRKQLEALTRDLSERSGELSLIVKSPGALPAGVLNSLASRPRKPHRARAPRGAKLG